MEGGERADTGQGAGTRPVMPTAVDPRKYGTGVEGDAGTDQGEGERGTDGPLSPAGEMDLAGGGKKDSDTGAVLAWADSEGKWLAAAGVVLSLLGNEYQQKGKKLTVKDRLMGPEASWVAGVYYDPARVDLPEQLEALHAEKRARKAAAAQAATDAESRAEEARREAEATRKATTASLTAQSGVMAGLPPPVPYRGPLPAGPPRSVPTSAVTPPMLVTMQPLHPGMPGIPVSPHGQLAPSSAPEVAVAATAATAATAAAASAAAASVASAAPVYDHNPKRPTGLTGEVFMAKLNEYWSARPGNLSQDGSRVGGVLVSWRFLYEEVEELGGIAVVVRKKLFSKVVKKLDIPPSITSASYELRKLYDRFLVPVLVANAWIDPAYQPAHRLHPSSVDPAM